MNVCMYIYIYNIYIYICVCVCVLYMYVKAKYNVCACCTCSVSYIGKSAGSCASSKESTRTAVRFRWWLIQRYKNLGLSRSLARGPGRATGPFRRTSSGEGVPTAQGRGHKTSLFKI